MSNYVKFSLIDDEEFKIPEITHESVKAQIIKTGKMHAVKHKNSMESMPLEERLKYIETEVMKVLGRYKGFVRVIRDEDELDRYIDKAIAVDYLSFDTETDCCLDPLTSKLMGACLYIPNERPVYVPINHCVPGSGILLEKTKNRLVPGSGTLLENQVSEEHIKKIFQRLKDHNTRMIYHNGKFDIRVCYNVTGVYLPIWWDTMIGSQLLDENEQAKLKYQYKVHVDPTIGQYSIDKLFENIPYEWIDPEVFALYAAIDAYDTALLQQQQQEIFEATDMSDLYKLFMDIEVPIVSVTAKMEDFGICMDLDFVNRLHTKYSRNAAKYKAELDRLLAPYMSEIKYYQNIGDLEDPINYDSSTQLPIVIYDILKIKNPVLLGKGPDDGEIGRPTDKETLKAMKNEFTDNILKYRHYAKLVQAFTEPLPKLLSVKDGKLHAQFNQMGKEENNVRTGRFSSTNPNLQQIPSKEIPLRLMFQASPGYAIIGSDYSAQEPRLLAHLANEEKFKEIFKNGLDPYASIAGLVFKKDYWECMETHKDGTPNPDGKKLRKRAKTILLGVSYGMGAKLMSINLGVSVEECKNILDEFYNTFPALKAFTTLNERLAKEQGYVEDYLGRRRRLPDAMKSEIEVRAKKKVVTNCSDIFIGTSPIDNNIEIPDDEAILEWTQLYYNKYAGKGFDSKKNFKELAKSSGIDILDNGAFISRTLTQCTNARIQGSAATLTKKAMVAIDRSKELNELGFRLLIPIHDELLGECPVENAERVEQLLSQTMIEAAADDCDVTMKCDPYCVNRWYADELRDEIFNKYNKQIESGLKPEESFGKLCEEYDELSATTIRKMCLGTYDVMSGEV